MAGVDSLDARFPTSQGVPTSDIVKAYLGLQKAGGSAWTPALRLPSGKFATNDLIVHLTYNLLRLMISAKIGGIPLLKALGTTLLYLAVMLAVILLLIVYPQLILAIPRALVPDFV